MGSGLFVFAEERHVMSVPRGVDSHAEMPQDLLLPVVLV
jgi:hypothetical protein